MKHGSPGDDDRRQTIFTNPLVTGFQPHFEETMIRFLFAIVLTATMLAGSVHSAVPTKADAAYGVKYTEARIAKLPQDGNKFYCTVFGEAGTAEYDAIVEWFETVPELKAFAAQTHFNKYPKQSTEYKQRYGKTVKSLPMIRVQKANGEKLFQVSGANIPMSGEALAQHLNTECLRRWRLCCPRPKPEPSPEPDDEEDVEPAPDDEDVLDDKPADDSSLGILIAIVAAGVLSGVVAAGVSKAKTLNSKAH